MLPVIALLAFPQGPDVWQPSAWWTLEPAKWVAPKTRPNPKYPASDPRDLGKWVRYSPMSDEFDGKKLDTAKWLDHNPGWKGRPPGYFDPKNVKVAEGSLQLTARVADPTPELAKEGYHTFSTAAVRSIGDVKYGYFEIRAKAMPSHASSAFWFYKADSERHTEIDVFEISGGSPTEGHRMHAAAHVFRSPEQKEHRGVGGFWLSPTPLADDFHVYGLEWNEREIRWYFDGVLVRSGPNAHWHQALDLNFDSETMPDWFGLPRKEDLPSTFKVDYVRAWKTALKG